MFVLFVFVFKIWPNLVANITRRSYIKKIVLNDSKQNLLKYKLKKIYICIHKKYCKLIKELFDIFSINIC